MKELYFVGFEGCLYKPNKKCEEEDKSSVSEKLRNNKWYSEHGKLNKEVHKLVLNIRKDRMDKAGIYLLSYSDNSVDYNLKSMYTFSECADVRFNGVYSLTKSEKGKVEFIKEVAKANRVLLKNCFLVSCDDGTIRNCSEEGISVIDCREVHESN